MELFATLYIGLDGTDEVIQSRFVDGERHRQSIVGRRQSANELVDLLLLAHVLVEGSKLVKDGKDLGELLVKALFIFKHKVVEKKLDVGNDRRTRDCVDILELVPELLGRLIVVIEDVVHLSHDGVTKREGNGDPVLPVELVPISLLALVLLRVRFEAFSRASSRWMNAFTWRIQRR